jgi:hypothetical protein
VGKIGRSCCGKLCFHGRVHIKGVAEQSHRLPEAPAIQNGLSRVHLLRGFHIAIIIPPTTGISFFTALCVVTFMKFPSCTLTFSAMEIQQLVEKEQGEGIETFETSIEDFKGFCRS